MKDDTISRQAAIIKLSHNKIGDDDCDVVVQKDIETIKALPSAQPEKRTEKRTETHACDLIDRQAAIDEWKKDFKGYINALNMPKDDYDGIMEYIDELPSAQPETAKRIVGKSRGGITLWYQCGMCNEPVDAQDNFCRRCGRRLTDG